MNFKDLDPYILIFCIETLSVVWDYFSSIPSLSRVDNYFKVIN